MPKKGLFKEKIIFFVLALLSLIYLANLGFGILELIPGNIPLWGDIDELITVLVLINSLKRLGINIPFLTTKG